MSKTKKVSGLSKKDFIEKNSLEKLSEKFLEENEKFFNKKFDHYESKINGGIMFYPKNCKVKLDFGKSSLNVLDPNSKSLQSDSLGIEKLHHEWFYRDVQNLEFDLEQKFSPNIGYTFYEESWFSGWKRKKLKWTHDSTTDTGMFDHDDSDYEIITMDEVSWGGEPDELLRYILRWSGRFKNDINSFKYVNLFSKYERDFEKSWNDEIDKIEKIKLKKKNIEKKKTEDKVSSIISEFDKDKNGIIDLIENQDFENLIKKHQPKIINIDRKYIQTFVKISKVLKEKEDNIQSTFSYLKKIKTTNHLNKVSENLKIQIDFYNLILFHSLNMVVSLISDDLITFYDIYETFDDQNFLSSSFERNLMSDISTISGDIKKISNQLKLINDNLDKIKDLTQTGIQKLDQLNYSLNDLNSTVSTELKGVNSKLNFNNFLGVVNTIQNYRTNQKLNIITSNQKLL
tara:strand:- start:75 stop:1445 length:1371 start_codon:yes stop_codon:yes gene_type:complete